MNINDFYKKKLRNIPIKMITCYDYWSARILAKTNIDCVLVGDSASMVMHGYPSTIPADSEMMKIHVMAVRKGLGPEGFIIADLPFLSYRKSISETMNAIEMLMKAGANAVKLEGIAGNETIIEHIVESGVPVMGHLGFTPQSVNVFGNSHVQGKDEEGAKRLLSDAKLLEKCGCFALVLECVPATTAGEITNALTIPTIGIGAGPDTSGQVLVLHDLIGADPDFNPKFLKKYLDGFSLIRNAIDQYCLEVDEKKFPDSKHCYSENKK